VLATVAMARHALGQPGRELLDEALALDPDAHLVAEAVRALDGSAYTVMTTFPLACPCSR
jgi:hypothetical protein